MEAIYRPETFKASEPVNLRKYFEAFSETVKQEVAGASENNSSKPTIAEIINMPECNVTKMENICSVDLLTCDGEDASFPLPAPSRYSLRTKFDSYPINEVGECLSVIKSKRVLEKNMKTVEQLLFENKFNFHGNTTEDFGGSSKANLTPGCDFVLTISSYKPFAYNFAAKNSTEKFRFSQDIKILGKNTLVQLRDVFRCSSDTGVRVELENIPDDFISSENPKEKYPSASFFIDGVFYNDMRSPDAIDYSEVVRKWAKDRGVGEFSVCNMELTTLDSLSPRFGYPYVYMHQGDCEHIFVFADARLLKEGDCLISKKYPFLSAMNRAVSTVCNMCSLAVAKWVCKQCSRFPQETTYLCTECCKSYNFIDNKPVGHFKLYPLFDKLVDQIN